MNMKNIVNEQRVIWILKKVKVDVHMLSEKVSVFRNSLNEFVAGLTTEFPQITHTGIYASSFNKNHENISLKKENKRAA